MIAGAVVALGAVPAIAQAGGNSETLPGDGPQVDVELDQNLTVAEDQGLEHERGPEDDAETDDEAAQAEDASAGDSETPIPAADIDRASAAAIAYLGSGRVTATEVEDEESYYEVEVTLEDGSQVDVQLDENFNVVSTEDDGGDG